MNITQHPQLLISGVQGERFKQGKHGKELVLFISSQHEQSFRRICERKIHHKKTISFFFLINILCVILALRLAIRIEKQIIMDRKSNPCVAALVFLFGAKIQVGELLKFRAAK